MEDLDFEEGEDEEELFELAPVPNRETAEVSSEAEGGEGEQESEIPDSKEEDSASSDSETVLDLQRSIIEDIRFVAVICPFILTYTTVVADLYWLLSYHLFFSDRKNEFGIGVELSVEGQKLVQVNQERLGRSLDRLSTELYSKDTHFVLELIQVSSEIISLLIDYFSLAAFYLCSFMCVS